MLDWPSSPPPQPLSPGAAVKEVPRSSGGAVAGADVDAPPDVGVMIAYLRSYEHMGVASVECSGGRSEEEIAGRRHCRYRGRTACYVSDMCFDGDAPFFTIVPVPLPSLPPLGSRQGQRRCLHMCAPPIPPVSPPPPCTQAAGVPRACNSTATCPEARRRS